MPKLSEQQIYKGLTYRKSFLDLITRESFLGCFANLRLLTREVIISVFSMEADSTASFDSCRDVYEYATRLERSLGFSEAKWVVNINRLYQFFDAILATGQFDPLKLAVREFKSELTELASGDQLFLPSIEITNDIPMSLSGHLYVDTPSDKPIEPITTYSHSEHKQPIYFPKPGIKNSNQLDLDRCYTINKGIRGICCIINIYRNFSTYDVTDGLRVFESLNYRVITFDNITVGTFISSLRSIRKKIEELDSDSFILIFSSHGDPENVMFADGKRMPRERIILEFLPVYCPCLAGKPKLFFFQNCRGDRTFEIDNTQPDPHTDSVMQSDAISSECARIARDIKIGTHLPTDIMRFYASTDGSVAYRLSTGSIFLQSLYEILQDESINRESLNELQSDLVRRVTCYSQATLERNNKAGGQVPEFKSSLVKKFYFKHPYL